MPEVLVEVALYPGTTTGIELEELSSFTGWVDATSIAPVVGEEGLYTATVSDPRNPIRARYDLGSGSFSRWFKPREVTPQIEPTAEQEARLAQAAIAKATRFLVLPEAPLGSWGEMSEFGMAVVRPDYSILELLFGLHYLGLVVDWASIVTTDDVIREGLSADPADMPPERIPDIQRALDSAIDWIEAELEGGVGIA